MPTVLLQSNQHLLDVLHELLKNADTTQVRIHATLLKHVDLIELEEHVEILTHEIMI